MDFCLNYDPFVDELLDYVHRCFRNATDTTGHILVTGISGISLNNYRYHEHS